VSLRWSVWEARRWAKRSVPIFSPPPLLKPGRAEYGVCRIIMLIQFGSQLSSSTAVAALGQVGGKTSKPIPVSFAASVLASSQASSHQSGSAMQLRKLGVLSRRRAETKGLPSPP
jgi:hypothetical protein